MTDRLTEIKVRCEAATPGPWVYGCRDIYVNRPYAIRTSDLIAADIAREEDRAFIAHAREDIPWLLADLERVTRERDEMEKFKAHSKMVSQLNNCNTCTLAKICGVRPGIGEPCRINCFLWSDKDWSKAYEEE